MARGHPESGGGLAGAFVLLLVVGFVVEFIWWIVGAAALVGLFFVGRAVARSVRERRELAVERELDLKLRADRQHRWTLAGDSRGVYGADGAAEMRVVSPPVTPPTASDAPAVAQLATTESGVAALVREKPSGWEWALFTSVLVQRENAVLPRLRDSHLGFTPTSVTRVSSGPELERMLLELVDEMLSTARRIDRFMAAPAFRAAFGGDGSSGDADAISHVAHRLMDYHERLLQLSERCRSISAPSYFDTALAECGRLLDRPLEGYHEFITELADVVAALPLYLRHATGDVDLGSLALDVDVADASRVLRRLRTLSR